jgi:lipopolysaccharide/colanic/teichoic acid biosynthesis glycosyltransferase
VFELVWSRIATFVGVGASWGISSDDIVDLQRRSGEPATAIADGLYCRFGKRVVDLVLSLPIFVVLLPVIILLMAIVAADGAPPIFLHRRVGRDGRMFSIIKLRTMAQDAERLLPDILASDPEAAHEWDLGQKLSNDPRVTRVGRFLRQTSLDELPQLWNIVRGEMSLVGPRPVTNEEIARYGRSSWAYRAMRPGLTGLWQATARNDVSYDDRVEMDVLYARKVGLLFDVRILMLTVWAVIRRSGC